MADSTFILIGGAPTTGKSTLAKQLSLHLGVPYISTDQLREVAKPYADAARFPNLCHTVDISAEEFLGRYSPQEISDMEFDQGAEVWPAVMGMMACTWDWEKGGIIEGVNILPQLVAGADFSSLSHRVKSLFVVDHDEARMRKVVFERGLYGDADSYSDDVKDKEVEWAMLFTKRLHDEARAHGLLVLEVTKTDDDLHRALKLLDMA